MRNARQPDNLKHTYIYYAFSRQLNLNKPQCFFFYFYDAMYIYTFI